MLTWETLELFETITAAPDDPMDVSDCLERVAAEELFRRAVNLLARKALDELVFPDSQVVFGVQAALRAGEGFYIA